MFRTVFALAVFCAVIDGRAASFTQESAAAHALHHNPELRAARLAIAEAEGRLLSAGRRANPELETEVRPNVQGREFSVGVGLLQRFPLTDRLLLEKTVSRAQLAVAVAEVRSAERRLVQEVRSLVVKMQSLKGRQALTEAQIANSRELAKIAAKAAASGEGSPLEAEQLELEAQQLTLDLLRVESERTALAAALRPLLGMGVDASLDLSGELAEPRSPGGPLAELPDRPEMQAARARVDAARHNLALEQKNRWQDAAVGLTAEIDRSEDAPDGLQTDGFVGLKFSLPLPFWNKNEGRIREAEATTQRREAEADALAAGLRAEAAAARAGMLAAAQVHDQTSGPLLAKARQLEERVLSAYQSGQAPLTDVVRSRERRLALEAAALDARRDYNLARVRFEAAMGR